MALDQVPAPDMAGQKGRALFGVAGLERGKDRLVVTVGAGEGTGMPAAQGARRQGRHGLQPQDCLEERRQGAGCDKAQMEPAIGLLPRLGVEGLSTGGIGLCQVCKMLRTVVGQGMKKRESLQNSPHFKRFEMLRLVRLGHAHATPWKRGHKAICLQPAKSLAHRDMA